MPRLLDRNRQVPGGLGYYQSATKWKPPPWSSFNRIVTLLISHRKGNPALVEKYKWATDYDSVANEVDEWNARNCQQLGWTDYITQSPGASPPPKPLSPQQRNELGAAAGRVKKLWSGIKSLNEWIDSGDPPVPTEQSTHRASICSECPENGAGDFTRWFTVPASDAIKAQMSKLSNRQLSTPYDHKLNICERCLCPMKLKCHEPIAYIKKHMAEGVYDELAKVKKCWVVDEIKS